MHLFVECLLAGNIEVGTMKSCEMLHDIIPLFFFRVENAEEPSLEPILSYLCDIPLQKDKSGMWACIKW